jgi:hypothetical protein
MESVALIWKGDDIDRIVHTFRFNSQLGPKHRIRNISHDKFLGDLYMDEF